MYLFVTIDGKYTLGKTLSVMDEKVYDIGYLFTGGCYSLEQKRYG